MRAASTSFETSECTISLDLLNVILDELLFGFDGKDWQGSAEDFERAEQINDTSQIVPNRFVK